MPREESLKRKVEKSEQRIERTVRSHVRKHAKLFYGRHYYQQISGFLWMSYAVQRPKEPGLLAIATELEAMDKEWQAAHPGEIPGPIGLGGTPQ